MTRSDRMDIILDLFDKFLLDAAAEFKKILDEKMPCEHEPEPYTLGSYWQYKIGADQFWKHGGQTVPQELFKPTCKYCSKPIKPKDGWVEV